MGRMNIPNLKPRPLASQPAGTQSRKAPLVSNLGERIGLIHKLGQLARAEKLLQGRRDRLVVDELLRHEGFDILQAHLLLDGPLHAHKPDAEMILDELPDGSDAPIAQMIDVIDRSIAVFQLHEVANHFQDILFPQCSLL